MLETTAFPQTKRLVDYIITCVPSITARCAGRKRQNNDLVVMNWYYTLYIAITFASVLILGLLSIYVWQRRDVPAANSYFWMLQPALGWMLFFGLELISNDLELMLLWNILRFCFSVFVGFTFLVFVLEYTGWYAWLRPRFLFVLAVIPICSLLLTLTNSLHGLMWSDYPVYQAGPYLFPMRVFGPWFFIHITYTYGMSVVAYLLLVHATLTFPQPYRLQAMLLLIACLPVSLAEILHRVLPNLMLSPMPIGYAIFGPITVWVLFRHRLLDLAPVAYRVLVQSLPDAVIVLNEQQRIVNVNPAAERFLGLPRKMTIGRPVLEVLPSRHTWEQYLHTQHITHIEIKHHTDAGLSVYDALLSPLLGRHAQITGRVIVLRDITEHHRAEEALRKFYRTVEQSPASVVITDTQGTIEYVNPKFTQVTGYTFAEARGQNPRILKTDRTPPGVYTELWATIQSGHPWEGELCNRKKNGEYYWEAASISPIFDGDGKITHFVAVKIDITERKHAEEALQRSEANLARAQEVANLGSFRYYLATDEVIWSRQFCRLAGLGDAERRLTLADVRTFIHPDDLNRMQQAFYAVLTGTGSAALDLRMIRLDGTVCFIHDQFEAVYDAQGRLVEIFGTVQDITTRKLAEEALKEARDAAQAANKAKSTFLANMSHELRTPLNAILGFTQMLRQDARLAVDQREYLDIVHHSGEHLLALINDVLDMSKIEAGRITLNETAFDLYHLLMDLQGMFQMRASQKRLRLDYTYAPDVPRYICTDQLKLRQTLINLLSNAIKFTPRGSVNLRVMLDHEEPGSEYSSALPGWQIIFAVEDTGPGIPVEEHEQIFEAFTRTSSSGQVQEGTGLGLAISRTYAHLMGGDLTVQSEVGRGSCFTLRIRAGQAEGMIPEAPDTVRRVLALVPDQPGYRILIVDDVWHNRRLLRSLLVPLGFEVQEARNGVEALRVWETWRPHLIFIDMRIAVQDEYAITRQIKAATSEPATVIVAVMSNALEQEPQVMLTTGCDDCVRTPFSADVIFDVLRRHLGVHYVYAADQHALPIVTNGTDTEAHLSATALATLPSDLLEQLEEAVLLSDLTHLTDLVQQVEDHNSNHARQLKTLIYNFQYESILELIQAAREMSP